MESQENQMNKICFIIITLICTQSLYGREPYQAVVIVNTDQVTVNAPNLTDLRRDLRGQSLEILAPTYNPTSPVNININLRGLLAEISFAANSTILNVNIPNAGITTSFDGGTRDQSIALFKQYLTEVKSVPKLLKAYAKYSPIDPIAGNPNSLIAQMAQADFLMSVLSPKSGCSNCWSTQPIVHQFQAGTYASRAFSHGYDTTSVTLPLRYSYSPNHRFAIILDAPFTYNRNGGASSVYGSLGMGLKLPVTNNWSLTATYRIGSGGSIDLVCSGNFVSCGLINVYNQKIGNNVLTLTNYVGFFTSTNLWLGGVNFNYHLQKTIFKNGLSFTTCKGMTILNREVTVKASIVDTYFKGNRFYIRHFDEVSVALITTHINPCLKFDCLSLAFAYQFGDKSYKSYALNMTYQF